ncbi:MAG: peptide chain release factor N(5)-glutamine methyltransferase [Flavobacteriaceae bacterium]
MTLKVYRKYFSETLSKIYPQTEIDSFFFLLLEEHLKLQRIDLSLQPNTIIDSEQLQKLNIALERLLKEEPIQYILGKTEFYGLPFIVNKDVLIPRPETEELVAWVLKDVNSKTSEVINILDIGTGSGCIPIALAKHIPKAKVSAIDVSLDAIATAYENSKLNNVDIDFLHIDILNTKELPEKYDIIVSNPPYVRELEKVEIKNNVLENEPHLALFVENSNPLIFYDKIANLAKIHLEKDGCLFFEINQYLGKETVDLLKLKGFSNIELRKDLFGNHRMIKASR